MGGKVIGNKEALEKALIEVDALASAGELPAQEAEKFLDYVVDETGLKSSSRVVRIPKGNKWKVNKIGVGRRNMVLAEAGVDPGVRRGITTSVVNLETIEVMVPFDIGDGFLERNVEGMSAREHVVRMMATSFSNDSEETWVLGDVRAPARIEADLLTGGDPARYIKDELMGGFDGMLRLADGANIIDAAGANFGVSVCRQALLGIPTKYRRNRNNMRLTVPPDILELWRERQSSRATVLGDQTTGGGAGVKPFGLITSDLALLPMRPRTVHHATGATGVAIQLPYTNVQNVVVTPQSLGKTPTAAYTLTTDYTVDLAVGTVTPTANLNGVAIKITYETLPQLILTEKSNLILGLSGDVRIERDRNIHRRVSEFVITSKIGIAFENLEAVVKIINIGTGV